MKTKPQQDLDETTVSQRSDARGKILGAGRISRVTMCGCRGVQLTIGAMSLRLPPGALEDVQATINEAVARLEADRSHTDLH